MSIDRLRIEYEAKVIRAHATIKELGQLIDTMDQAYQAIWLKADEFEARNEKLQQQNDKLHAQIVRMRRAANKKAEEIA